MPTLRYRAITLVCIFFSLSAKAQLELVWKKTIPQYVNSTAGELTAASKVGNDEFIAYKRTVGTKVFPQVMVITASDSLVAASDLATHPALENLIVRGIAHWNGDTVIAVCDDYKRTEGKPCPHPAEMLFRFYNNQLELVSISGIGLSSMEGITGTEVVDAFSGEEGNLKIVVHFHAPGRDYVNMYHLTGPLAGKSVTFEGAVKAKFWWSDANNVMLSTETPFSPGSSKTFYEVQILNNNLSVVRKYPDVRTYLDSTVTDKLVAIEYRSSYHMGFLARQVRNRSQENLLNWYGFNGYENGYRNKLIGDTTDILSAASIHLDPDREVIANGMMPGPGGNNWVVTMAPGKTKQVNSLYFSVDSYMGQEHLSLPVGNDVGDVIASYGSNAIRSFYRFADNTLYLVTCNPGMFGMIPEINITKWKIDPDAPGLQ